MAEIVLITGVPGTGKTAKMVSMMANDAMFQPDENGIRRKVFTNIKGLQLPHIHVITDAKNQPESTEQQLSFHDMHKWISLPENMGSIIVIDEAQDVFPARSNGSKIPENVSWLNTHRHLGVDIFVLSQSPKLLDSNLRSLVRRHIHIAMNRMGMRSLLEWKTCQDNPLKETKTAFFSPYVLPKNIFDLYKSAEIHTTNKQKKSLWFYMLPVLIVLVPLTVFFAYHLLKGWNTQDQAEKLAGNEPVASEPVNTQTTQIDIAHDANLTPEQFIPTLAERPESKPLYNGVRQVKSYERVAACIQSDKTGCNCYSDQATKIKEVSDTLCREYVKNGLPFDPFRDSNTVTTQTQQTNKKAES